MMNTINYPFGSLDVQTPVADASLLMEVSISNQGTYLEIEAYDEDDLELNLIPGEWLKPGAEVYVYLTLDPSLDDVGMTYGDNIIGAEDGSLGSDEALFGFFYNGEKFLNIFTKVIL
jgi:hypothetical protein